jgi:hypothetical protein
VEKGITIKKFDAEDISLHQIFVEVAGRNENSGMEAANV